MITYPAKAAKNMHGGYEVGHYLKKNVNLGVRSLLPTILELIEKVTLHVIPQG